jgi:hypothetical protein
VLQLNKKVRSIFFTNFECFLQQQQQQQRQQQQQQQQQQ